MYDSFGCRARSAGCGRRERRPTIAALRETRRAGDGTNPNMHPHGTSPLKLALAFGCIYFIWGSTFLAIRYAVETIPPFTMAGMRFLSAGLILFAILLIRREPLPEPGHW